MVKTISCLLLLTVAFASCKKENTDTVSNNIIFKFKFDSTQARLNNIGQTSPLPAGNAGQNPLFNGMSAHYIELAPLATTQFGKGIILYQAAETSTGGVPAIDFSKSYVAADGGIFYIASIRDIPKGDYEWLRISLAYQNYDVKYYVDTTISGIPISQYVPGTIASFIGFNTYISNFTLKTSSLAVNGNRKQGYWGFESTINVGGVSYTNVDSGQSAGTTTVVNPINSTSPIPAGSCVVTGQIKPGKLTITGNETKDIVVEVSLSTNKSFEWKDDIANGRWDPLKGEKIVDMGIRGMIPTVQ